MTDFDPYFFILHDGEETYDQFDDEDDAKRFAQFTALTQGGKWEVIYHSEEEMCPVWESRSGHVYPSSGAKWIDALLVMSMTHLANHLLEYRESYVVSAKRLTMLHGLPLPLKFKDKADEVIMRLKFTSLPIPKP